MEELAHWSSHDPLSERDESFPRIKFCHNFQVPHMKSPTHRQTGAKILKYFIVIIGSLHMLFLYLSLPIQSEPISMSRPSELIHPIRLQLPCRCTIVVSSHKISKRPSVKFHCHLDTLKNFKEGICLFFSAAQGCF